MAPKRSGKSKKSGPAPKTRKVDAGKSKKSDSPARKARKVDDAGKAKSNSAQPRETKANKDFTLEYIIKSPIDVNAYGVMNLENGLKALLISSLAHETPCEEVNGRTGSYVGVEKFNRSFLNLSDGQTTRRNSASSGSGDKSDLDFDKNPKLIVDEAGQPIAVTSSASVTLCVGAGSLNDPESFPGMAHLCEHACAGFGSKNYPEAYTLTKEVSEVEGASNAVTFAESTLYMFQVDCNKTSTEKFERLVAILADSVENPRLPAEQVKKEVHAVDCEFGMSECHDGNRIWCLLCASSDPKHPFNKFSCGNSKTLAQDNLHAEMCAWKKRHYAANYMTLVIQAPLKLEDLANLTHKYFANFRRSELPAPMPVLLGKHGNPFDTKNFRRIYKVFPVLDIQLLWITWVLPKGFENEVNFKTKPFVYLGSLFDRGSSLFSFLQEKHWALGLGSSTPFRSGQNPFCSTFCLTLELTDAGVQNMNEVVKAVFSYLKMIKNSKPQSRIFEELSKAKADLFHYGPMPPKRPGLMDYIDTARNLQNLKESKYILTSQKLMMDFDSAEIQKCVELFTPRNMNIMICSKSFKPDCKEVEPWHKTLYSASPIPQEFIAELEAVKVERKFELPEPNPYRIKNFICPLGNLSQEPSVAVWKTNKAIVVYENKHLCAPGFIPIGLVSVMIISSNTISSEASSGLLEIWRSMMADTLTGTLHLLEKSNVRVVSASEGNLIRFYLLGPSSNLTEATEKILKTFSDSHLDEYMDENKFQDFRASHIRNCKNFTSHSERLANDVFLFVLVDGHTLCDCVRIALEGATLDDLKLFVKFFQSKMLVGSGVTGCVHETNVRKLIKHINGMEYREIPEVFPVPEKVTRFLQLPLGERCIRMKTRNQLEGISRVQNYYQFEHLDDYDNQLMRNLGKIMFTAAFVQLRNVEHLSYVVLVHPIILEKMPSGFIILVFPQPHRHTTGYVDERIDNFLADFREKLGNYEEFSKTTPGLPSGDDYERLLDLYDDYLLPTGRGFRKLSVQVIGHTELTKVLESGPVESKMIPDKIQKVHVEMLRAGLKITPRGREQKKASAIFGLDVPDNVTDENGYFLTDLRAFKASCPLFGYSPGS